MHIVSPNAMKMDILNNFIKKRVFCLDLKTYQGRILYSVREAIKLLTGSCLDIVVSLDG